MKNTITSPQLNESNLKAQIIAEILKVYPNLDNEFRAQHLFIPVRQRIFRGERRYPFAETIMRYFRQLREDGIIKCECTNKSKSLYKKQ